MILLYFLQVIQNVRTQKTIAEIEKSYVYTNTKPNNSKVYGLHAGQRLEYFSILCCKLYRICLLYEGSTWTEYVHPEFGIKGRVKVKRTIANV
jgi:hypothetical protein